MVALLAIFIANAVTDHKYPRLLAWSLIILPNVYLVSSYCARNS